MGKCKLWTSCIVLLAWLTAAPMALGEARLEDIRLGAHPDKTRIVLDLSDTVTFKIFTLAEPFRIVVDLPELKVAASKSAFNRQRGLVRGYRFGQFKPGNSRLVVDTVGPAKVAQAFVLTPRGNGNYRFVMDLVKTDVATFMAGIKPIEPKRRHA